MSVLTIAFLAKYQINARFGACLIEALDGLKCKSGYIIKIKYLIGKSNLAHARSIIVTEWYDTATQGDLFMFIDSDHTFLDDDILKVINQNGDLRAGIYANRASGSTSIPETNGFLTTENNPLAFAATGFLCFTYDACKHIHTYMKQCENLDRVIISDNIPIEDNCIPFFHPLIDEINTTGKKHWLGEDFSFSLRAKKAGLKIHGAVLHTLGHELPYIVKYKPKIHQPKKWPTKSIVYYCGNSRIRFGPDDISLGGSEQAVVFLSKEFVKKGYEVVVYGNVNPTIQDGVKYIRHEEFIHEDNFHIIILWRRYGIEVIQNIESAESIFIDLHDPTDAKLIQSEHIQKKVKKIFLKSQYHRSLYPQLPDSKIEIIANGLQIEKIKNLPHVDRSNKRFCYTSCYERGLIPILTYMWPRILQEIPDAELHIFYGNTLTSEKTNYVLLPLLKQQGVYEHGRLSHTDVLLERKRSLAQLYYTDSPLEIDCLSIREAASVGCVPIISTKAVFSERAGLHIEGDPSLKESLELAAEAVIKLYNLPSGKSTRYRVALIASALTHSWLETSALWLNKMG